MAVPDDGRERVRQRLVPVMAGYVWRDADVGPLVDAVLREIEAAGYVLVERERLERIGLALWSMIEEEDYRDEILGLEPGDRAAIPGALTGRVGE